MIIVSTDITFKELLNFNFYKFYKNPLQIIFQIIIAGIVLVWLISLLISYPIDSTFNLVAGACLFQFGLIVPLRIYLTTRKEYKFNRDIYSSIEYSFTKDGIFWKARNANNFTKWEMVEKVIETDKIFGFFLNKDLATMVPIKDFEKPKQLEDLRNLIKSQLNLEYKLRKD